MQRQRLTHGMAISRQDVKNPGRNTGFERQRGDTDGRQRGFLGGFEYHRVAGGQGRAEFPARHQQRKIPGHNSRHHADRLAGNQAQLIVRSGCNFVIYLIDRLSGPTNRVSRAGNVHGRRVTNRLAHIEGFQQRQLFTVLVEQIGKTLHHPLALGWRLTRPDTAVKHGTCVGDSLIGVGLITTGNLRQHAAIDRRYTLKRLAAGGALILAGNKRLPLNLQGGSALLPILTA